MKATKYFATLVLTMAAASAVAGNRTLVAEHDCDTLEINYNLLGTAPGSMMLKRLSPGKGRICSDWVWIGSPID